MMHDAYGLNGSILIYHLDTVTQAHLKSLIEQTMSKTLDLDDVDDGDDTEIETESPEYLASELRRVEDENRQIMDEKETLLKKIEDLESEVDLMKEEMKSLKSSDDSMGSSTKSNNDGYAPR